MRPDMRSLRAAVQTGTLQELTVGKYIDCGGAVVTLPSRRMLQTAADGVQYSSCVRTRRLHMPPGGFQADFGTKIASHFAFWIVRRVASRETSGGHVARGACLLKGFMQSLGSQK